MITEHSHHKYTKISVAHHFVTATLATLIHNISDISVPSSTQLYELPILKLLVCMSCKQ